MGLYSRLIFPRICDFALGQPHVSDLRRQLLAGVSGNILEIGFGTGLNLPHYPEHVRNLTVIDPNPGMHRLAQKRLQQTAIAVEHRLLGGEQLPFDEGTFDCVVSSFTLCSIPGVSQTLNEVLRVLRPGGQFRFLEHGLSPDAKVRKWQKRLNWLEGVLCDGCRLDVHIPGVIQAVPFADVNFTAGYADKMPWTHGYLYRGIARK